MCVCVQFGQVKNVVGTAAARGGPFESFTWDISISRLLSGQLMCGTSCFLLSGISFLFFFFFFVNVQCP